MRNQSIATEWHTEDYMIKFENKENGRYYYLSINRDLLNEFVLTIARGGRNIHLVRHLGYACIGTIHKEIERLSKRRLKRGYTLVS